jgi:tetratricopeptide (TPR) repeat protein
LPKKIHWKVLLDLADFAKRENEFSESATLFKIVTHLQPYAHQGWLEHAKMEEELGNIERCRTLLKRGLKFNPLNENLFLKTLKIEEKEGNYHEVKKLIESLKNNRIEDTYKLLLEGVLYEGRSGNTQAAQKALKFLCKRFYGNGKVFLSAAQFEERIGNITEAIRICEEGLESNYTFGPLWFLLIKLAAKVDSAYQFRYGNNFEEIINEAVNCICTTSSDLISKLYMEASQFQETKDNIELARKYLKEAAVSCTNSHKWKVWIIGSRIEARIGSLESSKSLIERSLLEIPQKKQSIGLLEYAKYFEVVGNMSSAFKILSYARKSLSGDWKVFFESVLAYIRNGYFEKAEKLVKESLKQHFVTGRLWATLIQLKHAKIKTLEDSKKAYSVFLQANRKIPKSGEVWCEGARLLMSPMSHKYDLQKAEKYLNFAIQFTPQYGDSFLELFKLYTLKGETSKIEELKVT